MHSPSVQANISQNERSPCLNLILWGWWPLINDPQDFEDTRGKKRAIKKRPGSSSWHCVKRKMGAVVKTLERKVKIAEIVLRCLICGMGALAAALVASDSQVKVFLSIEKKAEFTDVKALVFLVIANAIAAGYSLIQATRCVVTMVKGGVLFSKPLAWAIFSCDQVLAYLTFSAVAAAAQSGLIGEFGQPQLQWMKICYLYGKFCNQVGEGIASALVVSLSMVALSCVSAFNLFRLYGSSNKGKDSGRW